MIDGYLVAVTVFSLGIATVMAVIAWRVIRLDRRQADAREDSGPETTVQSGEPAPMPGSSALPPTGLDIRRPHRAVQSDDTAGPRSGAAEPLWADRVIERTAAPEQPMIGLRHETAEAPAPLEPPARANAGSRRFAIGVGVGALVVTSAIGSAMVSSVRPDRSANVSPAAARVASPLELVSLDTARDGDRITIRGLVRNPAAGTRMEHLQAVIFLFDRRGGYIGTTQATVLQEVLPPGSDSAFEVPLAAGLQIGRYRVSFRVAIAPVPHIDRRPASASPPTGQGKPAGERAALAI